MQKRQKILLGLMGLTILVALYLQFSAPQPGKGPGLGADGLPLGGVGAPAASAGSAQELLAKVSASTVDMYKLGLMADNSTQNPFFEGRGVLTLEEEAGAATAGETTPLYSGYIRAGKRAFAVIDGIEYASGDQLAESDYRVQSIEKDAVVLERTDAATGRKMIRRVPLVEDATDNIRIRVVKRR